MNADRPTVSTEGRTLMEAVRAAATELGVEPSQVDHKLDAEHFRNKFGGVTGADTVRIHAWVRDEAEYAGGEAARAWLGQLVEHMGLEGSVKARIRSEQHADLIVDSPSARFLVGRQGRTLKAIRHLLAESIGREHSDWTFHLEITGGEDRRDRDDRSDRGDRGDRDDRRSRGRDRDRRGGDRDDDRRRRRSDAELDSLRRLATKLAERVAESGKSEVIRKRLNSYERRVVHVTISEIAGVGSQSVKQDGEKRVEIYALTGDEE